MTFEEAAPLVWQVLISAADQRQVLTYEIISQKLDGKILARALGAPLDLVADYCEANDLPALTVLAVSKATGEPSAGYRGSQKVGKERERVYATRWFAQVPPTRADFEVLSRLGRR